MLTRPLMLCLMVQGRNANSLAASSSQFARSARCAFLCRYELVNRNGTILRVFSRVASKRFNFGTLTCHDE